jgi:hypothetical protein
VNYYFLGYAFGQNHLTGKVTDSASGISAQLECLADIAFYRDSRVSMRYLHRIAPGQFCSFHLHVINEGSMKQWKTIGTIVLYLALAYIGFAGFKYLATNQPLRFGTNEVPATQGLGVISYGYLITLVGVLLGSAYRELQARRDKGETQLGSVTEFATTVLRSIDFWLSLCGSPIVYALLWKSLEGGNRAGLTIMALQNGFCCTMVVGALVKRGPAQQPAPAGSVNPGG